LANFQSEREQLAQLERLFQQKQFAAGLEQNEVVLKQFPASFQLKFLKFKFLRELQKPIEAVQLLLEMHAMFGENIIILKELADMFFQMQKYPQSLVYYKKLLFLDSFNSHAHQRVKRLEDILEAGADDKLDDTKIEFRIENGLPQPPSTPAAATSPSEKIRAVEAAAPPQISFDTDSGSAVRPDDEISFPRDEELNFETESAAELYFKQGQYHEALAIYVKLFEKTGRTDFFLKIKAIQLLLNTDRSSQIIDRLQRFSDLIQQRGRQIVQNDF
jgi:tetratricopeptide (TPR) repeat protein